MEVLGEETSSQSRDGRGGNGGAGDEVRFGGQRVGPVWSLQETRVTEEGGPAWVTLHSGRKNGVP